MSKSIFLNFRCFSISIALDSRLEFGVEESIEIFLRTLADKSSCNLLNSVNSMMPVSFLNTRNHLYRRFSL